MEGRGVHEVVIENPDHAFELADLPVAHVRDVLGVFQKRILAIERDLHYQYVQVFKNKGKEAGASLSHPHSQIVATPIIPKRVKEEIYGADRLFRTFKECAFCRILREEEAAGSRLIARNAQFTAFAPYASRFPFEMTIYPKRHSAFFTDVREDELRDAGRDPEARPDPAEGNGRRPAVQPGPPPGPEPVVVAQEMAGDRAESRTGTWRSFPS